MHVKTSITPRFRVQVFIRYSWNRKGECINTTFALIHFLLLSPTPHPFFFFFEAKSCYVVLAGLASFSAIMSTFQVLGLCMYATTYGLVLTFEKSKNRTKSRLSKTIELYNQWKAIKEEKKLICFLCSLFWSLELKQDTNVDVLKGGKGRRNVVIRSHWIFSFFTFTFS